MVTRMRGMNGWVFGGVGRGRWLTCSRAGIGQRVPIEVATRDRRNKDVLSLEKKRRKGAATHVP